MPSTDREGASETLGRRVLEGRVALVTGGGSGIGRATALALAELGAAVTVTGRRPEALERVAAMHPEIERSAGDVSRVADAQRIVRDIVGVAGRLDIVVNNRSSAS